MFKGVNKLFILGTVVSKPEIKYTSSNKPIATVIILTEDSWKDKTDGRLTSRSNWHKVILFNKMAENTVNYIKENDLVYIEGSLKSNRWKDKDNITRYNTDVVAITIQVLNINSHSEINESFNNDLSF